MQKCKKKGCSGTQRSDGRCYACEKRKYRKKFPIRAAYQNLRNNAKRRGKAFSITLEEFTQFCHATNYHKKKGRRRTAYTIDRIDETKGYTVDNIQCIQNWDNVRKYIEFQRWYDEQNSQMRFYTRVAIAPKVDNDCPF